MNSPRFISLLPLIAFSVWGVATSQAQTSREPRLSISQVGLHFICTADGQPDMYSWRLPMKDPNSAAQGDYIIPVVADQDLAANSQGAMPLVSGGRTALRVIEDPALGQFAVEHGDAPGFNGTSVRLNNVDAIHWRDATAPGVAAGMVKQRYYSNYPPLSAPDQAGKYSTVSIAGSTGDANYGRYYRRHPGYDWRNWNWTLAYDTPLTVNEKRIQAMLHLELAHPLTTDPDKPFDFTLVISAYDMSAIQVSGRAVFNRTEDLLIRVQKPLFQNAATVEIGGVVDSRKLALGRRASARGALPADAGYESTAVTAPPSSLNLDLPSSFFTATRDSKLTFSSIEMSIRVYNTVDIQESGDSANPLQVIRFKLHQGQAPLPDLVTAGSYDVSYVQPSGGEFYSHPAVQAPRWWGFNRDGVLGRMNSDGDLVDIENDFGRHSIRGRFFSSPLVRANPGLSAIDPRLTGTDSQRLPGARALIYGYDPVLYPDLKLLPVTELEADPLKRIAYDPASNYNRPLHYGTDTVRTLAYKGQLTPKTQVPASDYILHPDYSNPDVHMAYGRGFDLPVIVVPPVAQAVEYGDSVSFSVTSSGTTEATYQWYFNNAPVEGATARVFNQAAVTTASQGLYKVTVTNEKGSVTSDAVALSVTQATIKTHPEDQAVALGANATFSVVALGENLQYQWRRNGMNLPNATTATLSLSKVKTGDAASYDVVVTKGDLVLVSEAAVLTINVALAIVQQPIGGVLRTGSEWALEVQAVGTAPLAYQWRRNSTAIEGATSARLTLTGAQGVAGTYDVIVSDSSKSLTSKAAVVTLVSAPPVITTQPLALTVEPGAQAQFSLVATGDGALQYQWRKNGVNIAKATASWLTLTNVQEKDEATYDCVVKNFNGATLSVAAKLTVGAVLSFSTTPEDATVPAGQTADFSALVSGEGVTYQWAFNGAALLGAVYPNFSVLNADASKAGVYTVTATRGALKASASAVLRVVDPGSLIYKLTGTGQVFAGAATQKVAFSGALIVKHGTSGSQAALVLASKNGSQNVVQVQHLSDFRVDSTGPALKTQTVFSDVQENGNGTRSFFWMQGPDSLVVLAGTDKTLAPKTLSGNANRLEFDILDGNSRVVVESIAFKATLDAAGSHLSRRRAEDLDAAIERVTTDLLLKGHAEIPAEEPQ